MEKEMVPGIILSRDEGRAARATVMNAHRMGYISMTLAVEMAWDIAARTVPSR